MGQLPSRFERGGKTNKDFNLNTEELPKIQVILKLRAKQISNLKEDISKKAIEKKELQK